MQPAASCGGADARRTHGERRCPVLVSQRLFMLLAAAGLALGGCASTHEPPNLSPHKQQVRAYVESGEYLRDMEKVAREAKAWLEARAAKGGSGLTVVFDLDETLLFNWPLISAMDFGYVPAEWDRWVDAAKVPPIEPVRDIYRTARRLGIDVVFLTGRPESTRASTERNLRAIDCGDFASLICRPAGDQGTTAQFKTAVRQKLIAGRKTIIANIGDQLSDLIGGAAERTFKLPNAFYVTD
jgi:predicted secreted acid phosphatase